MRHALYRCLFVLLFVPAALAQEFTGNINGRVTDESGAVIPGVTVTLKSPAMLGERTAVTDESGSYRFILLPQGDYVMTYELPGFKTLIRERIVVEVGKTTTINAALGVATLAETVTVTGESPVVDVQNATVGVNFNQSLLRDMPNSRDIWVVLAQTPGVTVTRFDVGGSTMGTQGGRKLQPYRGGQGANAFQYIVDSTYVQDSWSWVGKVQWTSVLNNRTTLDVSANNFGYHFPGRQRIQETPTYDNTTQARRGSYEAPFRSQARRWHWNANVSYFAGRHDVKSGYGLIWESPRSTQKGAPGSPGTTGHLRLYYLNGRPDYFETTNTPYRSANSLLQNFVFLQDKWQIHPQLTLNLGIRFDRFSSYYPEQGYPGTGPYQSKQIFARRALTTFNDVVPRVSVVYDLFGDTKTAIKASYGRYSENPSTTISSNSNPVAKVTTRYPWDGALPVTPALVARLVPLRVDGQAREGAIDPDLKNKYTDEYTAGLEHQLFTDFAVNATFVRKLTHDSWGLVNRAEPTAAFAPVAATDPGRDGIVGTADDSRFTVFERMVPAGSDNYYTNFDRGDNFTTFEFGVTKRFNNKWQLISGFDWTKRNLATNISLNPNVFLYGSDSNEHTEIWTYKLLGTYVFPQGFSFSGTYNAQKGEPYGRRINVAAAHLGRTRGLLQGTTEVYIEPEGAYYYPTAQLVNFRLEKTFQLSERHKIAGMFDLFNVANANTVVGVNTLTGTKKDGNITVPTFGRVTQIIQPRIFRLGVRYSF